MTDVGYCPLCGEKLPADNGRWTATAAMQNIGGWKVCGHHKVYLRPSKYAGRCHECLGPIIPGEVIILWMETEKDGKKRWSALHRRDQCEGSKGIAAGGNADGGPYAVLYLLPDAPMEVVKAAYRALATKYHPDLGGDNEKMAELNAAVAEITGK